MNTFQNIFDTHLQETFSLPKIGTKLIAKKMEQRGLHLSKEHLAKIEASLEAIEGETLTIHFDDPEIDSDELVVLDFDEAGDIDVLVKEMTEKLSEKLPQLISETSVRLLEKLKLSAPAMLEQHKVDREQFEATITERWGDALKLLEMLLVIALETGDAFNKEYGLQAEKENNYVFKVLMRLQARACQVSAEILTLLKAGFADGAHARWRTLHEISVVASFITQHGSDVAERYLLHNNVESYKAALQYQKHHAQLGYEPNSDQEMEQLHIEYQRLLTRFGHPFKNNYGWAADALKKNDPKFSDIEEAVGLEHLRPYYKLASHNVHAQSKGIYFKIGLSSVNTNLLLAGPINSGLADPGHGTAIALTQITYALLAIEPTIDALVIGNVLTQLEKEIGEAFLKAHEQNEPPL